MTLREAADSLGVTPDTLRQAIRRGALRATKRGRDHWVTEGAVEDYRRDHLGRPGGKKVLEDPSDTP